MQRNSLLILVLGFLLGALTTGAIVGGYMAIQVEKEHARVLELKMQEEEKLKAAQERLRAAQQGNNGKPDIFQGK